MTAVSVHIADVGLPKSLSLIRHPRPASIPGLLQANAGIAAKFGTTPRGPRPGASGSSRSGGTRSPASSSS